MWAQLILFFPKIYLEMTFEAIIPLFISPIDK